MSYTNAQVAKMIKSFESRMANIEDTLAGSAPAKAAPVKGKAAQPSGFQTFLAERAAAKVACGIHAGEVCNRKFSPKSSGGENHLARLV